MNVGCHADAYEQAKWFGDDITLKAGKYRYDARSARGALSGLARLLESHGQIRPLAPGPHQLSPVSPFLDDATMDPHARRSHAAAWPAAWPSDSASTRQRRCRATQSVGDFHIQPGSGPRRERGDWTAMSSSPC